jgi:serine/threonine protein kinase
MRDVSACPAPPDLQRFLVGHLSEADAGRMERHFTRCTRCNELAYTFADTDALVDALRGRDDTEETAADEAVERLIGRLKGLGVRAAIARTGSASASPVPANDEGKSMTATGSYAFLEPAQKPGEIGRLGEYCVLEELGHGGFGIVFKARDKLNREVALKVIRPGLPAYALAEARFKKEAETLAKVSHEHVAIIHDFGDRHGVFFLTMELLKGPTLDADLKRGSFQLSEVLRIGREIAEALAAIHGQGVVHRDIKPGNIFLVGPRRQVKVTDFGLAREPGDDHLTLSEHWVGTPAYMGPERFDSFDDDHRSDLFSLGVVLHQLCTNQVPTRGMEKKAQPPHQQNPAVPLRLSQLVMQLLNKEPSARPPTAQAVIDELKILEAEVAPPPSPPSLGPKPPWPRKVVTALIAATVLIGALAMAQYTIRIKNPDGTQTVIQTHGNIEVEKGGKKVFDTADGAGSTPDHEQPQQAKQTGFKDFAVGKDHENVQVYDVCWSADGKMLAVGTGSGRVVVYDWATAKRSHDKQIHKDLITQVEFLGSSRRLVSASGDRTVQVWDTERPNQPPVIHRHAEKVSGLACTRDGNRFASSTSASHLNTLINERCDVILWDAQKGKRINELTVSGKPSAAVRLAFSPDGRWLAGGRHDGSVVLWDTVSGRADDVRKPHKQTVLGLRFSADGRYLASGSPDQHVIVWDTKEKTQQSKILTDFAVNRVAFDPTNSSRFAFTMGTGEEGRLCVWDIERQQRVTIRSLSWFPRCLAYSPDGRAIAVGGDHTSVRVFDVTLR